tara:strand:- start:3107 stop:3628 length:522 start_codon:yes stop_codon:yes gene_type:complete
MVLDYMVDTLGLPEAYSSSKYAGRVCEGALGGEEVTLLYPNTFMNKSGSAVKKLVSKGEEEKLIVVYDDVDLPVGEIKISQGKGSGGHNGISSIVSALGSKNFVRVRVGIAGKSLFGHTKRPTGDRLPRHVLGDFKRREQKELQGVLPKASEAIQAVISDGVQKAMNEMNKRT